MQEPLVDIPEHIGRFTVVRALGQGGMGQVYLAHTRAGHEVVVKVIHAHLLGGHDGSMEREYRSRFSREAEAARQVGGLYTAPIVAADPEATPPWIATVYVPGPTLGKAVRDRGPFSANGVRQLAAHLAEGLEAIHACGLVHRDLKPANIIVSDSGPKIIDFGVARPVEGEHLTHTGGILGTPSYMSPEQAHGFQVTPASDVFSLATVLYFAATGANPFQSPSLPATLMRVVGPPPDPSALPADIADLLVACWKHDPGERPSPDQVLDILGGTNPSLPGAPQTSSSTPLAGSGPAVAGASGIPPRPTAVVHGRPVADAPKRADVPPVVEPLANKPVQAPTASGPSGARPRVAPRAALWNDTRETGQFLGHEDMVSAVAFSPNGALLATGCWDRGVRLWDTSSGAQVAKFKGHRGPVYSLAFSPDGDSLATAGHDRSVRLWDVAKGRRLTSRAYGGAVVSVAFSSNGEMLAVAEEGKGVSLLNVAGGRVAALDGAVTETTSVAFSPDGSVLAAANRDGSVILWDTYLGARLHAFAHPAPVAAVAFSPTGDIAAGCEDGSVRLWDLATEYGGSEARYLDLVGHEEAVGSVAFSPDGVLLATGADDHTARVWDTGSGTPLAELVGHGEAVEAVAFSPDGNLLATGSDDYTVSFWRPA